MRTQFLAFICLLATLSVASVGWGQDPARPQDGVVVKLLEPGANPRTPLRLTAKKGAKQTAVMTMKMDQAMVVRGQKIPPQPSPVIQFTIDVAVTDVAENGDIAFEYLYPKVAIVKEGEVASPTETMMEGMLKSIEGLKGSGVLTSRGFAKSAEIEMPEKAAAQIKAMVESMKDSMSKMSYPLPDEAIGVGGKWSVTQMITNNGMTMKQTSTHTLKDVKEGKFEVAVELTQSGEAQEMKTPGLPEGTKMNLKSLESTGTGQMLFSTNEIFPVSEMKTESKVSMEMDAGGQVQPIDLTLAIDMSFAAPAASVEATKK